MTNQETSSTHRLAMALLLGLQFAFLGIEFGEAWYSLDEGIGNAPIRLVGLIFSHVLTLVLFVMLVDRAGRDEACRFATLRRQMEGAVRQAEDLIQCSSDLVWEIDGTGVFTFVSNHNGIACGASGVAVGGSVQELVANDPVTSPDTWERQIASNRRGEAFRDFRYCTRRADGTISHFIVNGVPVLDTDGVVTGFRGLTRDCTREVEALEQMNRSLLTDTLTGLANRLAMRQWLLRAGIAVANHPVPEGCEPKPFAYLLLDLDGFKAINDAYGHAAGDEVLLTVATRLRDVLGDTGICARLGGDEFAIVIADTDEVEAVAIGQRIVRMMAEPLRLASGDLARFGISIGISLCPKHGTQAQMLFRCADQALYEVKRRGGGAVRVADDLTSETDLVPALPRVGASTPRAAVREHENAMLVSDLRGALMREEFHLVFQPIVSTSQGEITAYEALIRWTSPVHGNVSPSLFIPLAEEAGLILQIGAYVLRQACRLASEAGGDWMVTVNVSALQFARDEIVTQVLDTLAATHLPPERLILELTEQSLVSDHCEVRARMRALRAAGVRLALDDFGAGFANVSYLRDFCFDLVKIDRAILLLPVHQRARVLGALLQITQSFETPTVVEGIEALEDWTLAESLGCTFVQGFFLGRPAKAFVDTTTKRCLLKERAFG